MGDIIEGIVGLTKGYSLWDYVSCFFSIIPKLIYMLYASLASCLDALQCLLRRLAGLDVYYVDGQAVVEQDPVLGFIMGILGIGENAGSYSVLTTTFWSLAIFGLILLVISTMVAIIKSHYGEDSGKTSPVTYVYTAIKSILTFAIVPVVVIAGFWLSSFLLKTIDSITASSAGSEETIQGIYGSNYDSIFKSTHTSNDEKVDKKVYSRYDFFTFGAGSTNETFSGLIFKCAGYDANRIRYGSIHEWYDFGFGGSIDSITPPAGQQDNKQEWAAYQIDYAFANNLDLKSIVSSAEIYYSADTFLTIASVDPFSLVGAVSSFSKFNVGFVWAFYDLWRFNFVIGFAGVITCFWLMVNIVFGLMTRIIKSIALFIVYPGVLGLAPLDEMNAFKSWRKEFVQQVLMVFGSIIGMNLFFLIYPYLSNISFFNVGLLDYLVNMIIVITGLVMVKQLIKLMSGFVGGADAHEAGAGVAGDVKGALGKGVGMTLGAANVALKASKFIPGAGMAIGLGKNAIRMGLAQHKANKEMNKANRQNLEANDLHVQADALESSGRAKVAAAESAQADLLERYKNNHDWSKDKFTREARKMGLSGAEEDAFVNAKLHEQAMANNEEYASLYNDNQKIIDNKGLNTAERQQVTELRKQAEKTREDAKETTARAELIRTTNYMDKDGNMAPHAFRQMMGNDARAMGGAIAKGFKEGMKDLNINLGGLRGVFGRLTNNEYDDKGEISKTYGAPKAAYTTEAERQERKMQGAATRAKFRDSLAGLVLGYGNAGSKDPPKLTGDKLGQESLDETKKTNAAVSKLSDKIDDLVAVLKKKP